MDTDRSLLLSLPFFHLPLSLHPFTPLENRLPPRRIAARCDCDWAVTVMKEEVIYTRKSEMCVRHYQKDLWIYFASSSLLRALHRIPPSTTTNHILAHIRLGHCNKLPPSEGWLSNMCPSEVNFRACNTTSHKSSCEFHIWKFVKPQNHCHWHAAWFAIHHSGRFHHLI